MPEASTNLAQMQMDPTGGLPSIVPAPQVIDPNKAFDAVENVVIKRQEAEQAKMDALTANTTITNNLLSQQELIDQENLKAYDNLGKINQWGGDNAITKILGLFNPDYNKAAQETTLLKNQIRSASTQRRAETQININNAKPALLTGQAEIAQQTLQLYTDTLQLQSQFRGLEQRDLEINIASTRLLMDMNQDAREAVKLRIEAMDEPELRMHLRDAKAGKGPWVGMEGLLVKELNDFDKFRLELDNTRQLMKSRDQEMQVRGAQERRAEQAFPLEQQSRQQTVDMGRINIDNATDARLESTMKRAVGYLPINTLNGMINNAIQSGQGVITLGTGADAVDIPLSIAMEGAKEQVERTTAIEQHLVANDRLEVASQLNEVSSSLAMLASVGDARAGEQSTVLALARSQTNFDDPTQVRRLRLITATAKTKIEGFIKDNKGIYNTPEAQAAFEQAVKTGEMSDIGADALVAASIGSYARATQGFHRGAYQILGNKINDEIRDGQIAMVGMPEATGDRQLDTMSMLAAMNRRENREKIPEIIDRVMRDPSVKGAMAAQVKQDIEMKTLTSSLQELSRAPLAVSPIFKEMLEGNKNFSPEEIIQYLEQRSIEAGPGVDYVKLLIDQLNKYATDARNSNVLSDPGYTMSDRAVEFSLFGMDPRGNISREFVERMTRSSKRIRAEMEERKRADIRGDTTRQSLENAARIQALGPDAGASMQEILRQNPQAANPPSATGANLPVNRIQELYGR